MSDSDPTDFEGERAVDGRDATAIRSDAAARALFYTDEWDPEAGGPGTALLDLFSELAADVVDRLDGVPDKHHAAFGEALGFDRQPPQAAECPLTVTLSDGAESNVYLPGGTRALAGATETRPEVTYELTDGFEATPASLTGLISVDPARDHVGTHAGALDGSATGTLFGGENEQRHRLYLGHPDVLALEAGTTVQVRALATADAATLAALDWEYYAELPADRDAKEGWRSLTPADVSPVEAGPTVDVDRVGSILDDHGFELTTDDRAAVTRWLVSTVWATDRASPVPAHVDPAREPEAADAYRELDEYVREVFGEYPPETGTDLAPVALTFGIEAPFVETEQFGTKSRWIRASVPTDVPPPLATRLRAIELEFVSLGGGRLRERDDRRARARAQRRRKEIPRRRAKGRQFSRSRPGRGGGRQKKRSTDDRHEYLDGWTSGDPAEEWLAERESTAETRTLFRMLAEMSTTGSGDVPGGFPPDDLLANDVPLEVPADGGDPVRPFGTLPRVQDTFYIGSEEGFTKGGQRASVHYSRPADNDIADLSQRPPQLSWEYWNGSAWEYLDVADDAPVAFRDPSGRISFPVPEDLEQTTVSGHEGHWIRVRLVGGGYGEFTPDPPEDETGVWQRIDTVTEPQLESIDLQYEPADSSGAGGGGGTGGGRDVPTDAVGAFPPGLIPVVPAQCRAENNLASASVDPASRFLPFEPPPETEQTAYFGFDGPLDGGPLQTFLDLSDFEYPAAFSPRVRWEVHTEDGWQRVSVEDGSEGLTERGIVRFSPPEATVALSRFGTEAHWLRARVTGQDGFVGAPYRRQQGSGTSGGERCGDHLPTTPPGAAAAMALPEARLVAHNAGQAAAVRTITDEILGSSDGTPEQAFTVASPPIRSVTCWVDELATLSAGERERLVDDPNVTVDPVGPEGNREAFWVQWTEVEDLFASGSNDRHFAVDPIDGVIAFGDGNAGAIPPRGQDNIRVSYETGGGADGNVPAGAVSELDGSLAFVDAVTNPRSADGGADAEPRSAVLGRAGQQLRDRNRAVAPADFERIAAASARKLARARCLPGLGPRGETQHGWVTLLIVPRTTDRKPVPSATLTEQVTEGVADHAPASLLGETGEERLNVRGPSYVEVTVDATLVAGDADSFSALEAAAENALGAFLHPLSGGEAGEGWPFGELPCVSDCYGVLEAVAGVDHVADLAVRFASPAGSRTIRPGAEAPSVDADVLIYSGIHDIDVMGGS